MADRFRLFSIVFGEPYTTYFQQACVRSLMWPDNRKALERVDAWDIWTQESSRPRVAEILKDCGIPIEWHYDITFKNKKNHNLVSALIGEMQICRDHDAGMIFAAPDSVFGDGTIQTFMTVASVPSISPCLMPLRVNADSFLGHLDGPLSNPALVQLGIQHAHKGFLQANAELDHTNSLQSGVSWRPLGRGMYAVTTRVPSAYILQPTKRDVKWFGDRPKFGNYDHGFGGVLLEEGRQRIIGSSDAAFVVELSDPKADGPSPEPSNPQEPDRYFQKLPHYLVNRNTLCIWREGGLGLG